MNDGNHVSLPNVAGVFSAKIWEKPWKMFNQDEILLDRWLYFSYTEPSYMLPVR